jgi:hypothetical protein
VVYFSVNTACEEQLGNSKLAVPAHRLIGEGDILMKKQTEFCLKNSGALPFCAPEKLMKTTGWLIQKSAFHLTVTNRRYNPLRIPMEKSRAAPFGHQLGVFYLT